MTEHNSGEFIKLQSALAGRYYLEREVGRGGMGVVYLARDVALDRPVALKLLPPRLAAVPALRQRFLSEARTAAKLSHPNIVPIFAVEEAGDYVFFVMAFVDGLTLGQRVRERGPMPPTELTTLLREVSWGLAYAHSQGIVHRDVKADNILLEAGTNRALVADFGIASVAQSATGTKPGEILGTAEYMSPEQASGEHVDHRSDIYSLGIVAFYALSGKLPFEGHSTAAILAKQITQPAPPIAEVAEGVPSRLARAVDRCLSKDPSARFQQSSDLADALALALEARREAPMAIKLFIRKVRELGGALGAVALAQTIVVPIFGALLLSIRIRSPDFAVFIAIFLGSEGLLLALPFVGLLWQIRKLIRAGYTSADVLVAWKTDMERESEDRLYEVGRRPAWWERVLTVAAAAALPVALVASASVIASFVFRTVLPDFLAWTALFASIIGIGSGVLASFQYIRRTDLPGRWLGKLWKTHFVRACFDMARVGLRKVELLAPPTHRPTEMAIGMAVESLFAALDKPTQKVLASLPETVHGLEEDASRMRRRVEDLDDAVAKIESGRRATGSSDSLSAQREKMDQEIQAARDNARTRLADAVSALEGIRLNLLRLTAGTGTVEGLTTDLANAKEVSEEVQRLLQGQREVEAALKAPRT
ncbi:MAG TPA: protein kinase [Gemmatimonadales bacterium]|jgi:serine/threonine-protein kinase